MIHKVLLFLCLYISCSAAFSQRLKASFKPTSLGDSISTEGYDELNPLYIEETKTLFFTRANHPDNRYGKKGSQDIWSSNLLGDSSWSIPIRLVGGVNVNRYNNVLAVFDEGTSILVSGAYTNAGRWHDRGLAIFKRGEGEAWQFSKNLKVGKLKKVNDGDLFQVTLHDDLMIVSADKHFRGKKNKLFITHRKSEHKWSALKKLKIPNFKKGNEFFAPRLAKGGDTLFFSSNDGHDMNIYAVKLSELLEKGKKNKPVYNVCDGLNTKHNEEFISLNDDNEIAFFASDRLGTWDIFKVRRFESEKYIAYSGRLINQYKNEVLEAKYNGQLNFFEINSDGDTVNYAPKNFDFDSLSGEFQFHLPFGQEVLVYGTSDNFVADTVFLSSKGKFEFERVEQDIYVKPLLFADLSGVIRNAKSTVVNELASVKVFVNGNSYPDVRFSDSLNFEGIRLALGYEYEIYASVIGYDSVPILLDLVKKESYVDTNVVLLVKKKPDSYFHVKYQLFSTVDSSQVSSQREISFNGQAVVDTTVGQAYFYLNLRKNDAGEVDLVVHGFEDITLTVDYDIYPAADSTIKLYLKPFSEGYHLVLENVNFEVRKADITESSFTALDELAKFLEEYPDMVIQIEGHTDNVGSEKYNDRLSQNRAESVREYLEGKGIKSGRIKAKGYGFDKPLVPNDSEENRSKNRRVEFKILKAE